MRSVTSARDARRSVGHLLVVLRVGPQDHGILAVGEGFLKRLPDARCVGLRRVVQHARPAPPSQMITRRPELEGRRVISRQPMGFAGGCTAVLDRYGQGGLYQQELYQNRNIGSANEWARLTDLVATVKGLGTRMDGMGGGRKLALGEYRSRRFEPSPRSFHAVPGVAAARGRHGTVAPCPNVVGSGHVQHMHVQGPLRLMGGCRTGSCGGYLPSV